MLNLPFTETLADDPLSGIRLSLLLFCTYLPEEYNLLSPMSAIVHTRCCSQLNLFLSWIFHSSLGGNQNREVSLSSFINVRDAQVPSYPEMDIKPSTKTTKPRMTFDYWWEIWSNFCNIIYSGSQTVYLLYSGHCPYNLIRMKVVPQGSLHNLNFFSIGKTNIILNKCAQGQKHVDILYATITEQ